MSIRNRLLLYCALCSGLLLSISGFAIVSIVTLENLMESFDRQWLAGTQMLGDISRDVLEFRIAEGDFAAASDPRSFSAAKVSAAKAAGERHVYEIGKRRESYAALTRTAEDAKVLVAFDDAWNAYQAEHRAWAKALIDDIPADTTRSMQHRLDVRYATTVRAIGALSGSNRQQGEADISRGELIVEASAAILSFAAVLAFLLVVWVAVVVRNRISRPLAGITQALTELAAGNCDVVIPESRRQDEIGRMAQAFEIFRANAVALEKAQSLAEALAHFDVLTGLANRRVLSAELEKALGRVDRENAAFALLAIDLDRFKPVNDIHGHYAGDLVLSEITARLKALVRKQDTLARIGGDEFAIICELERDGPAPTKGLIHLAERVIASVSAPVSVGARTVKVGASIGIALCPADGQDAETLLRIADIAMYRAKRAGRGTYCFYEESMDAELRKLAALEGDIHRALIAGEIQPHYQPLIDLSDGRLLGFEILARWHHPEKGTIGPDVFIPVMEHLGLISDFTLGILRQGCLDAKDWPADLTLSLNVSPHELTDPLLPIRVLGVLSETGFPPNRLEIEITENALVADLEVAKVILQSLQNLGIKIALDDFGTGYSSLYHLRELKLDKIKIDRSFIQSMTANPESAKIVYAIMSLAKSLALPTTAEGIEDHEVMESLSAAGCEIGQGYYFGKAMPAAEALLWMQNPSRQANARKVITQRNRTTSLKGPPNGIATTAAR